MKRFIKAIGIIFAFVGVFFMAIITLSILFMPYLEKNKEEEDDFSFFYDPDI